MLRTSTEQRPATAPIVVTHQDGLRFAADVGGHELIFDQPVRGGGRDAGPSPLRLLSAALGGCVALYVYKFLLARDLATEGLRVEVAEQTASKPHRIVKFDVQITLPEDLPENYRAMAVAVARACPVFNTLVLSAEIDIQVRA